MSTENEDNKAQTTEQERIQRSIDNEFEVRTTQTDSDDQLDLGTLDNHYRVKNVKYGEKTVVGRVIGQQTCNTGRTSSRTKQVTLH